MALGALGHCGACCRRHRVDDRTIRARIDQHAQGAYRSALIILRIAALCLLLIMLAQWAIAVRITGPPALALVVDRSASMGIADSFDEPGVATRFNEQLAAGGLSEPTRLNLAKTLLTADDGRFLRELAQRYRMQTYLIAGGLEQLPSGDVADSVKAIRDLKSDGPDSDATKLGDNLLRVLSDFRGAPPAAVLLLTDGVNTAGAPLAEAAQAARRSGVPIYAVGIGRDSPPRDIELADVLVDDVVFVNDLVSLQAQIKASGLEGQPAKLTLRREGSADVIAEQNVNASRRWCHAIHTPVGSPHEAGRRDVRRRNCRPRRRGKQAEQSAAAACFRARRQDPRTARAGLPQL